MFRRITAIALFLSLTLTTTARAEFDPAEFFSAEDVPVVMRLKQPDAILNKSADFLSDVAEGTPFKADDLFDLSDLAEAMHIEGFDNQRDVWVGISSTSEGELALIFALPTNDAKKLRESILETGPVEIIKHNSYLVYATEAAALSSVKKCITGKGKSIVSAMNGDLRKLFESNDLSLFLNPITTKNAKAQTIVWLKLFEECVSDFGPDDPMGVDPIGALFIALFQLCPELKSGEVLSQLQKDLASAAIGISVDSSGVTIDCLTSFQADSPTSQYLDIPLSEHQLLTRLPTDGMFYYSGSTAFKYLSRMQMAQWESEGKLASEDPQVIGEYKAAVDALEESDLGEWGISLSPSTTKQQLGIRFTCLNATKVPQQLRKASKRVSDAREKFTFEKDNGGRKLRENAEKFGRYKADVEKTVPIIQVNGNEAVDPAIDGNNEDNSITRTVYTDSHVVTTQGGGKRAMMTALLRLQQPEAPQPNAGVRATREKLSRRANVIVLADIAGFYSQLMQMQVDALGDAADGFPAFPAVPQPSYFGVSFAAKTGEARVKIHLPTKQAAGLFQWNSTFNGNFDVEDEVLEEN